MVMNICNSFLSFLFRPFSFESLLLRLMEKHRNKVGQDCVLTLNMYCSRESAYGHCYLTALCIWIFSQLLQSRNGRLGTDSQECVKLAQKLRNISKNIKKGQCRFVDKVTHKPCSSIPLRFQSHLQTCLTVLSRNYTFRDIFRKVSREAQPPPQHLASH